MSEQTESTALELHSGVTGGELLNRRDMRNRATDSWTDVLVDVGDLAERIANTDFVPASFKGNIAAVAATILQGREVGFAPMTALSSLHSIKGKVGLYAEAMRALVFQAGHEIVISASSSATCEMKGRRAGSSEWTSVTWTIADARQAGLLNSNKNWATYPRQMLQARATTELCRLIFPDVIRGLASVEELETYDAPMTGSPAAIEGKGTSVKRAARKKTEPAATVVPPLPETGAGSDEGKSGAGEAPAHATDSAPPLPDDLPPSGRQVDGGPGASTPGPPLPDSDPDDHAATTPAPVDSSGPVPDDVVEAEVIEDEPGPKISAGQRTSIIMRLEELGVGDRGERLYTCSVIAGRQLVSANDMSAREASSVLDTLGMCTSREDLENVIQATVAHTSDDGGQS